MPRRGARSAADDGDSAKDMPATRAVRDDSGDVPATRSTRASTRGAAGVAARASTAVRTKQPALPPPPKKPAPGRAKNKTAGTTPHPRRKSAGQVSALEDDEDDEDDKEDADMAEVDSSSDREGEGSSENEDNGSSQDAESEEDGEEGTGVLGLTASTGKRIRPEEAVGGSDSDDDAPEEVSASVARGQLKATQRAEAESRRALVEQKKAANKQRELKILLAKQEQENARAREQERKAKQARREEGQGRLAPLDEATLTTLADRDTQMESDETSASHARKHSTHKYLHMHEAPSRVHKKGFVVQKMSAQDCVAEEERQASARAAQDLLASHFASVPRKPYAAVHVRKVGPAPWFAGSQVKVKRV